jgi:hypothetical protein
MIGAATMDLIDITIVNVALPTIRSDLDASGTQLQWVVSAYMLAFAAALIVAGSFGDVLGRKRIYWGRRGRAARPPPGLDRQFVQLLGPSTEASELDPLNARMRSMPLRWTASAPVPLPTAPRDPRV